MDPLFTRPVRAGIKPGRGKARNAVHYEAEVLMSSGPAASDSSLKDSSAPAAESLPASQMRSAAPEAVASAGGPDGFEPPLPLPVPTLKQVLLAPWVGIVRPKLAAQRFLTARELDAVLALLLGTLAISLPLLAIQLGQQTRELRWVAPHPLADTRAKQMNWHYVIRERGFGEILEGWYLDILLPGLAPGWIWTALVLLGSIGGLGLLMSTRVPRGAGRPATRLALKAAASTLGMLGLAWIGLSAVGLAVRFAAMAAVAHIYTGPGAWPAHEFLFGWLPASGLPLLLLVSVFWVQHVVAGVSPGPIARRELRTLCEGCGYDLRLLPPDGRCPECGLSLVSSLDPEQARPGIGWERRRSIASWLQTTWLVTFRPSRFYRWLPLRSSDAASRSFALSHALGLIVVAALLCPLLVLLTWSGRGLGFLVEMVAGPGLPLHISTEVALRVPAHLSLALLAYFVPAAVVARIWAWRGLVPEPRCAAKVLDYEAVWLWVFLLAALAATAADMLIDALIWRPGMPVRSYVYYGSGLLGIVRRDLRAALIGLAVGLLLWLVRLRKVRKAIRWANF